MGNSLLSKRIFQQTVYPPVFVHKNRGEGRKGGGKSAGRGYLFAVYTNGTAGSLLDRQRDPPEDPGQGLLRMQMLSQL